MIQRVFLALLLAMTASSAAAQEVCVARSTPDVAAELKPPLLFAHCVADGKCGALDKTGAWRVPPMHREVMIAEDFIVVPESAEWDRYGFLDAKGTRLGGGEYQISIEEDLPVSEGLMPVLAGEKMGYVDRTGTLVIPPRFDEAMAFDGGKAQVVEGEKLSFIDRSGAVLVSLPEGLTDVYAFEGDVAVAGKDGMYGLVDSKGEFILSPKYSSLYSDHGVLIAGEGDVLGIVDQTGQFVSKPEFGAIGQFSNGVAPAQKGELWGFIDTCGRWTIEPKYEMAVGFEGGPARVKIGGKWGLIDRDGREIAPPSFAYIGEGQWLDGLITFTNDDAKYGLIDTSGKVVVEPAYDSIEPMGGGVLISFSGEEQKMHALDGSEIKIAPAP